MPLLLGEGGPPRKARWGNNMKCDICRENLTGKRSYSCSDCSINICVTCFETKGTTSSDGAETENVVRSDKGRSKQVQLTTYRYFRRVLGFAKHEQHYVVLAMSCLLVASLAGLMNPNYQVIKMAIDLQFSQAHVFLPTSSANLDLSPVSMPIHPYRGPCLTRLSYITQKNLSG